MLVHESMSATIALHFMDDRGISNEKLRTPRPYQYLTVSRSQNRFLKNVKSSYADYDGYHHNNVKHDR